MKKKLKRGFARMTPERRREIAALGGKRAHAIGKAHQFTPREASVAGAIGGKIIGRDREHMRRIGRRGGSATARAREEAEEHDG